MKIEYTWEVSRWRKESGEDVRLWRLLLGPTSPSRPKRRLISSGGADMRIGEPANRNLQRKGGGWENLLEEKPNRRLHASRTARQELS